MLSGIFTLMAMLAFLGVWVWAWSRHRQADFARAAQLPLIDEPPSPDQAASRDTATSPREGDPS